MLGERVDWDVDSYLLARIAHLLAGANWQRGGGKGPKPKPVKVPGGKPRRSRRDGGQDTARRLRNLGLIPGHAKPGARPLTPREQALAEAIERAQRQPEPEAQPSPSEPSPAELQQRIHRLASTD